MPWTCTTCPVLSKGTHSLAPRPGSLVRWTFQKELAFGATNVRSSREPDYHLTRIHCRSTLIQTIGPRGRIRTCNLPVLSGTPRSDWATRGKYFGAPGQGCTDTLRILNPLPLLLGYGSLKLALPAGISPATSAFEARRSIY